MTKIKADFGTCIILFNPDKKQILNIVTYLDLGKVYIVDNSPLSNDIVINLVSNNKNINYFWDGINHGIAESINTVAKYAYEHDSVKFMLCMDQDSYVTKKNLKKLQQNFYENKSDNLGLYAISTEYSVIIKKGDKFDEIQFGITSGSIVPIEIMEKIGWLDEKMFIDGVDRDFCKRLELNKYDMLQDKQTKMEHSIGDRKKNILGVSEHNPVRNYYIFRNRLYYMHKFNKYFNVKDKIRSKYLAIGKQIMSILLFESNKIEKIKYILKARRDYVHGVMGRLEK